MKKTAEELCREICARLEKVHIACFEGMDKPLFLISETYPGIWLEHVYDSVFYATMNPEYLHLAENTVELFIDNQKEDGQLPCYVIDPARRGDRTELVGYTQIQECVSFARLALMVYRMGGKRDFLEKIYRASAKWAGWLERNRMTLGLGLVEAFVGFDTGHDRSGRLEGLSCPGKYIKDGVAMNAAVLPPNDNVAPLVAVDMNCNFFGTLTALSEMAEELGLADEAKIWRDKAKAVKARLFELCFDKDDCFFYDVDKHGNKRKYLSSTVFHLFLESLVDKNEDKELIDELFRRHIGNPDEFATPYPYPSMAICDPSCEGHAENNCWGYFSQGLIALRCTLWMDKYGFGSEFDRLCKAWVDAWSEHFDTVKMGQELDPITGVPTDCSEWYSSTMLFYLYAAKRLGKT